MPNLYIIAGCNGAGKTTASFTVLPEILNCKQFVNADIIAADISPLEPEKAAFEAGRIMLTRVRELMLLGEDLHLKPLCQLKATLRSLGRLRTWGIMFLCCIFG